MTNEEKAAKKAAEEAKAGVVTLVELVKPIQSTLIGSVEMINFKSANLETGGKFAKDTYIVALSVPKRNKDGQLIFESKNIFVTERQWKEYGCESVLYVGNYVRLTVEHCIEGVTGYKETADSEEMVEHTKTFDAFVGVSMANADALMMYLESVGVSERMTDRIIAAVSRTREAHESITQSVAQFKNPFGG